MKLVRDCSLLLALLGCAPQSCQSTRMEGTSLDRLALDFEVCPKDQGPCRVLPLGDSITYGMSSADLGGYRVPLLQKARAENKSITFVGSQSSGPETLAGEPFPRSNEGYPGWTIEAIGGRPGLMNEVKLKLKRCEAQVILLHIGTNDIAINARLGEAPDRLGQLLDTLYALCPHSLLIVAKIIPTTLFPLNTKVSAYNQAMDQLIATRKNRPLLLVNMESAFLKNPRYAREYFADELHPKELGFEVMADVWYTALRPYLP